MKQKKQENSRNEAARIWWAKHGFTEKASRLGQVIDMATWAMVVIGMTALGVVIYRMMS